MAATKNLRTIIAAATANTAGSTTTGTVVNLTTAYGGFLTAAILNGVTGPTVAATVSVYVSGDNVNFKLIQQVTAGTANATNYPFSFPIDAGIMYLRADVSGNTVQSVTCEAFLQELTTI